jgi:hypothetical protein
MKEYKLIGGTHFTEDTPEDVAVALELARVKGLRVRLFYGDQETGKAWNEENDVTGYIGRSFGPEIKAALLIPNARSIGGGAVLSSAVVAIKENSGGGGYLYKHRNFHTAVFKVESAPEVCVEAGAPVYPAVVTADGELYARCKSYRQAARLVAFMNGYRGAK